MPHYAEDPIIEAILGVRVTTADPMDLAELRHKAATCFVEYPTSRPLPKPEVKVRDGEEVNLSDALGFAFEQNGNRSVHVRLDEFSFHQEAPYSSWNDFFPEAYKSWLRYREVVDVNMITSVFMRYVNRIELPRETEDLSRYFTSAPNLFSLKGARISRKFSQFLATYPSRGDAHVIATQLTLRKTASTLPYILDIDVHNHVALEHNADLEGTFKQFRRLKNEVFEQLIKDPCRKLLKVENHVRNR